MILARWRRNTLYSVSQSLTCSHCTTYIYVKYIDNVPLAAMQTMSLNISDVMNKLKSQLNPFGSIGFLSYFLLLVSCLLCVRNPRMWRATCWINFRRSQKPPNQPNEKWMRLDRVCAWNRDNAMRAKCKCCRHVAGIHVFCDCVTHSNPLQFV